MPQEIDKITMKNLSLSLRIAYVNAIRNEESFQNAFTQLNRYYDALAILNERSDETKAVRQNEQTQEVCCVCGHDEISSLPNTTPLCFDCIP